MSKKGYECLFNKGKINRLGIKRGSVDFFPPIFIYVSYLDYTHIV